MPGFFEKPIVFFGDPVSFGFSFLLGQVAGRRRSTKPRTLLPDFPSGVQTTCPEEGQRLGGAQTRPGGLAS